MLNIFFFILIFLSFIIFGLFGFVGIVGLYGLFGIFGIYGLFQIYKKQENFINQYETHAKHEKQIIPFANPFNPNFYKDDQHEKKYSIGLRKSSFGEIFANKFLDKYNKKYYTTEFEILKNINNYNINYGVISLETWSYFIQQNPNNNIRFIASLTNANINILAKNGIDINLNYNGIYNKIYKINVLYENSLHHLSCKKLLNYLNISKYFTFVFNPTLENTNYDIIYYIGVHPIKYLINIQQKINLHYININFFEHKNDFLHLYKSYEHELLDINNLFKIYQHLTIIDKRNNYIKTIKTKYIFISNDKTDFKHMNEFIQIKKNLLFNYDVNFKTMNQVSLVETSYNTRFNIPYNNDAKEYYNHMKIHSTVDNIYHWKSYI